MRKVRSQWYRRVFECVCADQYNLRRVKPRSSKVKFSVVAL